MIKPEVPYENWKRCNMYPKFGRNEGSLTATDRFFCSEDIFDIDQLESLESFEFRGLMVSSTNVEVNETSHLVYITMIYSKTTSDNTSAAADGVSEYTLEDSGQEIPIDMRTAEGSLWFGTYKTKMNYILAAKKGTTASWSGWTSATDTRMSEADALKYRWCKDASDVPEGWYVMEEKTKRIESVLIPSPVVVETTRYSTYNEACGKQRPVGSKANPAKTFNYSGEWLVTSSNIYADGKKWVCQTRYQNAKKWDGDFYS